MDAFQITFIMRTKTLSEIQSGISREEIEKLRLETEMYSLIISELKDIDSGKTVQKWILYGNFIFAAVNIIMLILK